MGMHVMFQENQGKRESVLWMRECKKWRRGEAKKGEVQLRSRERLGGEEGGKKLFWRVWQFRICVGGSGENTIHTAYTTGSCHMYFLNPSINVSIHLLLFFLQFKCL